MIPFVISSYVCISVNCFVFICQVQGLKQFKPEALQRRGPDCCRNVSKLIVPGVHAVFCGTVLHFRGLLTVQPLELNGNILLWNGEVFAGLQVDYFLCVFFSLIDQFYLKFGKYIG